MLSSSSYTVSNCGTPWASPIRCPFTAVIPPRLSVDCLACEAPRTGLRWRCALTPSCARRQVALELVPPDEKPAAILVARESAGTHEVIDPLGLRPDEVCCL